MKMGVAKPRSEAAIATEEQITWSYNVRSRRAAVSFNAKDLIRPADKARGALFSLPSRALKSC